MSTCSGNLATGISAHKYHPPLFDPGRHLFREKLVATLVSRAKQHRLVFIEAQAGQGKSTVATQMLSRLRSPFGWYRIGPEDGDPVLFLGSLLTCLTRSLPAFSSPVLAGMLRKGEVDPFESIKYLNILLADLARHITRTSFIFFDDLHLLEEHPLSQSLLAHLFENAPRRLHFVLISRRHVRLGNEQEAIRQGAAVIGNESLRLSEREIFVLFNDILTIPISLGEAGELRRITEGWIMGLILAREELNRDCQEKLPGEAITTLKKGHAGSLADYFRIEIFPRLAKEEKRALCRLSLLSTVPVPLAEQVTEEKEISTLLDYLAEKNYFVSRLNREGTEFAFHHLFQEALRLIADDELSTEERGTVLKTAGDYFLALKQPEEALLHYQRAGDLQAIEDVLAREGMELFALNRLATIESVLSRLPEDQIAQLAWMPLFMGLIRLRTSPPHALPYLELARRNFEEVNDDVGRVLALSQLIHFHAFMDCRLDEGAALLPEAESVFLATSDRLHLHSRIQAALSLSTGYSYCKGDMTQAGLYSALALRLSVEHGLVNFRGLAIVNRGLEAAFIGKQPAFLREIEGAYLLQTNPNLNHLAHQMLMTLPFNYLAVIGDADGIRREMALMKEALGEMAVKSISVPFCILFEADARVGAGQLTEALELIREGLAFGYAAGNPHLKSQYLHHLAYISSLNGERKGALTAATDSASLRSAAGGKVFDTLNRMILGGTYAQLEMTAEAEAYLGLTIRQSVELGEEYMRAGAYAHRAALRLRAGCTEQGLEDLAECLACMSKNGYTHFFSWTPALMQPLLQTAVSCAIDPDYARKLATERLGVAILPGGISIPLLEIRTMGELSLSVEGETVGSDELTPLMRKLLALLLSAPGRKISQEEVLVSLWPDVSESKSRSRFDTLLLELRKTLKAALAHHDPTHYLALRKGMLCLSHCRIDAVCFAEHARCGLDHVQRKEFWQAGNSFRLAASYRKGGYLPGSRGDDQVSTVAEELDALWHKATLAWGKFLMDTGRLDECIDVLSQYVINDLTSDDHATMLYQAHLRNNQPILANKVLMRYEEALKAAGFDPDEIVETLEAVRGKLTMRF